MTKLSHTSVSKYNECSLCYKLHYINGIRPKKTKSSLIFGGIIDKAFNTLLQEKDLNKARKQFKETWNKVLYSNKIEYAKSDLDEELVYYFSKKVSGTPEWDTLLYKGLLFIETYYKEVLPKIKKIISIQEKVSLKNNEGDEIYGALDAIVEWENGKIYIIDNKTSSVKYEENSAREDQQLPLYYYICKEKYKLDGVGYIVLSKKINKNRVKKCKKCGVLNESSHKTCNEIINNDLYLENNLKPFRSTYRCNGEFEVTINPTVELQFIFNELQSSDEDRVLKAFDDANYGISNNLFSNEHNSNRGKFGYCPYKEFYPGNPDFIEVKK